MKAFKASVLEIQQSAPGKFGVVISLPAAKIPKPGQYFQAHRQKDKLAALPTTLFPSGMMNPPDSDSFCSPDPIPSTWQPGDELLLRGPLGRGFQIARQTSQLAIAVLDADIGPLLPLAGQVLGNGGEVAIFTNQSYTNLPPQVEISPLSSLKNALLWANFLAVCGTPEQVTKLKGELVPKQQMPCPAQVLVMIPMPCGGLSSCGVCAFPDHRGKIMLACENGPVFDWETLPRKD